MTKVLVVGPVFIDSIYAGLPEMPKAGQEVYGTDHLITVGGFAINAIGFARLGLSPMLVSAVGDDLFGTFLENRLRSEGVATEGLVKVAGALTSHSTAMVFDGDRRFVSYAGAELTESELLAEWVKRMPNPFDEVKLMHIGLRDDSKLPQLLQEVRSHGVLISLTCGWPAVERYRNSHAELVEILRHTDLLFCNEIEALGISGKSEIKDALRFFKSFGCRPVITLGEKGAITLQREQVIHQEALSTKFVDATGAGDSFATGFLTGIILGWPISRALKLGVVCGSLSITALGGTEAFPQSLESIHHYLGQ